MSKGKVAVKTAKGGEVGDNIRVVMPSKSAYAVASVFGDRLPALRYDKNQEEKNTEFSWYQLEDLSNEVANMIATTAQQFHDTIELVKKTGQSSMLKRFSTNVEVVSKDLENYTNDFIAIRDGHKDRNGFITEANDRVVFLGIFEKYQQLAALFQGTMHHKMVEFTEYALEAKDLMVAAENAAQEKTQPETETPEHNEEK